MPPVRLVAQITIDPRRVNLLRLLLLLVGGSFVGVLRVLLAHLGEQGLLFAHLRLLIHEDNQ